MAWLSPVGRRPVGLSRSLAASRACPRLDWWRGLSEGGNDSGVTPRRTHYHVLGLTEQASSEEIKQAYYRLSKLYHPDRNQADPESMAKFHEVTQAHDILGHAALRRQYDKGTLGQHTSVADLERASHTVILLT
ncbi:hypothetical protein TCAL_04835 [Tigriopus californicus]|uniref:J domain-containing protein n=1 Tax=Tigriopus californicus TaxID=6832 RepID=A0A553NY76_TIGCA|nr:hypothetical protein TCAL_04835 [Tigriopus californicus]|eukprot:TCALIF_04835-PA protein Name:"Similar to Dnajc5 DnaJ homolog subfamily C member 5 (Rattus norvegicus)" AED:0.19 eAED:0.19 QI:0/-1/0/1/-1/1/1/0/133